VLPPGFIAALEGQEELIVTSRESGRERSVRAWYALAQPATIYLFTESFSLRAARWRRDPWVRLRVPGGPTVEGTVHQMTADALDDTLIALVTDRWWMWGATTAEGLRRMLRDGSHVLMRVDVP
jgi:hypothetical protein